MKANKFTIVCSILLLIGILCITIPSFFVASKAELETSGDISFYLEDKLGNKTSIDSIPQEKNYEVSVDCNKNAIGTWNHELWRLEIKNLAETLTRCDITFAPERPLLIDSVKENIVTSGNGVYKVNHDTNTITAPLSEEQKANLKRTEYRYAGQNPNNYILFQDELWRMIGLVNTPDGQKIKLIRNESIGTYSWDSSDNSINSGYGVNEWSQADIMKLLNPGYQSDLFDGSFYWNSKKGKCYSDINHTSKDCDFSTLGMKKEIKDKADETIWNLGSNSNNLVYNAYKVNEFYNFERSNVSGKSCSLGSNCNDTISRNVLWTGKVGLIYPSDYGYGSSGGVNQSRETCFTTNMFDWKNYTDCYNTNWLHKTSPAWTLMPMNLNEHSTLIYDFPSVGGVGSYAIRSYNIFPSVYLKTDLRVLNGVGSQSNPYILK